jgi:hypothetical protein
LELIFESQGDGLYTDGDDSMGLWTGNCQPAFIYDGFLSRTIAPCPLPDGTFCNLPDESNGGTNDGAGGSGRDGIVMTYELRHPMNSGDFRDMAIVTPRIVDFYFDAMIMNLVTMGRTVMNDRYPVR